MDLNLVNIEDADQYLVEIPKSKKFPDIEKHARVFLDELIQEANKVDSIDLSTLKLVSIAVPFAKRVHYWQRELGLHEWTTQTPYGVAMGKEITWRGKDNSIKSMVIFSAELFLLMLQGSSFAKSAFFHELAHVHDESLKCSKLDSYEKKFYANNLPLIRNSIADSIWSEYFAERTAYRHLSLADMELIRSHTCIIDERFHDFEKKRIAYRDHHDVSALWSDAISSISVCATTIGRLLGSFFEYEKDQRDYSFIDDFNFSSKWKEITSGLKVALNTIYVEGWSNSSAEALEPFVMQMWEASSIVPSIMDNGVYIDVPTPPREEEYFSSI